jgi:GntR family transcriptional regulator
VSGPPRIDIDLGSGVPPYEQIRAQVAGHVASGALRVGDRLPTVRALAADLGIATGTVARAYRELEAEGVVAGRRRLGTVVTGKQVESGVEVALAARALVERARAAGLADSAVLDLVAGLLRSP